MGQADSACYAHVYMRCSFQYVSTIAHMVLSVLCIMIPVFSLLSLSYLMIVSPASLAMVSLPPSSLPCSSFRHARGALSGSYDCVLCTLGNVVSMLTLPSATCTSWFYQLGIIAHTHEYYCSFCLRHLTAKGENVAPRTDGFVHPRVTAPAGGDLFVAPAAIVLRDAVGVSPVVLDTFDSRDELRGDQ